MFGRALLVIWLSRSYVKHVKVLSCQSQLAKVSSVAYKIDARDHRSYAGFCIERRDRYDT